MDLTIMFRKMLGSSGIFPYIFIVSNNEDIREMFKEKLLNEENIIVLERYSFRDNTIISNLKISSVFLDNIEENLEEFKKYLREVEDFSEENINVSALYYSLIFKREAISKTGNSIFIICDEDTITPIIKANSSLSSCSQMFFVDELKRENEMNLNRKRKGD